MKQQLWDNAFAAVEDVMDEMSGRRGKKVLSSEDEDEEDERDGDNVDVALRHKKTKKKKKKKKVQMYEARTGGCGSYSGLVSDGDKNVSEGGQTAYLVGTTCKTCTELRRHENFEVRLGSKSNIKFYKGTRDFGIPGSNGGGDIEKRRRRRREAGMIN